MDKHKKTLNNTQRKALAELIQRKFQQRISEERDKAGMLAKEITDKIKVELGVDTIENQIAALESQIENLKDKRSKLGFNTYGLEHGSKAYLLVEARTRQQNKPITELEKELTANLMNVWTVETVEEAKALIEA